MPPSKHSAEVLFGVPKYKKADTYILRIYMQLKRGKPNLEQDISDFWRNYKFKKKSLEKNRQKEGWVKVPEVLLNLAQVKNENNSGIAGEW